MNPAQLLRRLQRNVRAAIQFVLGIPRSLNLMDRLIHAFAFPQHDWAKRLRRNLADDQLTVTWRELINPLHWLVWSVRFSVRWIVSRPYMTLAPAIPAAIVAMILLASILMILRRDQTAIQTKYLDKLRTSIAAGDTEVAAVAAQRLLAIDPDNMEHQYQLAMLEDELGQTEAARTAILRLALEKQYGPAALWMLKFLVYEDVKSDLSSDPNANERLIQRLSWSQEEQDVCHQCATVAMTRLPSQRALLAKKMYAGFLAANGLTGDAFRLYEAIAQFDPEVNLVAAQLAAGAEDYLTAQRFAKAAIRHLEPQVIAAPSSVELRLKYCQALVLDERDDEAFNSLMDGVKLTSSPILKIAAGEALVFKSERLKRNVGEDETLIQRVPLLRQAVTLAPQSGLVLEAVVRLAIDASEADEQKRNQIRQALLSGVTPVAMHFVEGTVLLMNGDLDQAQHHLELAAKEWDNMPGLLNNLAVTLAESGDESRLPQALRLSDAALKQLPGHPYLLETRGQIYLRMKRYQDAITDLEKTLADANMRPLAHKGLAEAYEALGVEDLAAENRRLAEKYARESSRP